MTRGRIGEPPAMIGRLLADRVSKERADHRGSLGDIVIIRCPGALSRAAHRPG